MFLQPYRSLKQDYRIIAGVRHCTTQTRHQALSGHPLPLPFGSSSLLCRLSLQLLSDVLAASCFVLPYDTLLQFFQGFLVFSPAAPVGTSISCDPEKCVSDFIRYTWKILYRMKNTTNTSVTNTSALASIQTNTLSHTFFAFETFFYFYYSLIVTGNTV